MNPDEWEAFTERAAIMEYDGGLSRKAAVMAAFQVCFPADYRECTEAAAADPDGETALYEFLEGLIKTGPESLAAGPPLSADTNGHAPDDFPKAQEPPPMEKREGPEALAYMTGKGIALIGVYDNGATIAKGEAWAAAFTTDMAIIDGLRAGTDSRAKGRINRFYFIPQAAGLLCLDIDRKNGKDGIQEFYAFCDKAGKPRHLLPRYLQDLPQNFPCYVETPSSGLHLYFRYAGGKVQKKPLSPQTPGVELKHGAPGLTAPGSYKNGKPYILHGDIENAPPLPAFILESIQPPKQKAAAYVPIAPQKKEYGRASWDKIREWTETDGGFSGRNDKAFQLARHARNHDWTEAETLDAMRGEPGLDGLPEKEIETAVHSAYKGKSA